MSLQPCCKRQGQPRSQPEPKDQHKRCWSSHSRKTTTSLINKSSQSIKEVRGKYYCIIKRHRVEKKQINKFVVLLSLLLNSCVRRTLHLRQPKTHQTHHYLTSAWGHSLKVCSVVPFTGPHQPWLSERHQRFRDTRRQSRKLATRSTPSTLIPDVLQSCEISLWCQTVSVLTPQLGWDYTPEAVGSVIIVAKEEISPVRPWGRLRAEVFSPMKGSIVSALAHNLQWLGLWLHSGSA